MDQPKSLRSLRAAIPLILVGVILEGWGPVGGRVGGAILLLAAAVTLFILNLETDLWPWTRHMAGRSARVMTTGSAVLLLAAAEVVDLEWNPGPWPLSAPLAAVALALAILGESAWNRAATPGGRRVGTRAWSVAATAVYVLKLLGGVSAPLRVAASAVAILLLAIGLTLETTSRASTTR